MSAHPKVDKRSGHFCTFGYSSGKNGFVSYSLFNKERKLLNFVKIPIASTRMLHDFAITENYIVIPDLPMEANIPAVIKDSKFLYQLNPKKPSRYGFMKRYCQDISKM